MTYNNYCFKFITVYKILSYANLLKKKKSKIGNSTKYMTMYNFVLHCT